MRFEPLQKNVGWNFENNVRDEKDSQGDIGLIALQMQVFRESHDQSIGNVDPKDSVSLGALRPNSVRQNSPVQESSEVDDKQDGQEPEIDFPDQSLFIDS